MRRKLLLLVVSVTLLLEEFPQSEALDLAAAKTTVIRAASSPKRTLPDAAEESHLTRYTPNVAAEIWPSVLTIEVNDDVKAAETVLAATTAS